MSGAHSVERDEKWGRDCLAYNLQANLEQDARAGLVALQREIAGILPDGLLLTPAATMHVSLYALVYVHWDAPDKQAYWEQVSARAEAHLEQLCNGLGSFVIHLDQVRVSRRAIIALSAQPCAPIARLRSELSRLLAVPEVPRPSHDIVHTTLARFADAGQLDASSVQAVERLTPALAAPVTSISIMRELVYPSLVTTELRRFVLGAG